MAELSYVPRRRWFINPYALIAFSRVYPSRPVNRPWPVNAGKVQAHYKIYLQKKM
jgi:hypothetical protein